MNSRTIGCPGRVPALPEAASDSLFERAGWLYAFLRARVFRNDTDDIARALELDGAVPSPPPVLVEVGCGPGFYACRLARRFPKWKVVGLDLSRDQLGRAGRAARRLGLRNCVFRRGDALALDCPDGSADGLLASRLFTVLDERAVTGALSEMYRVLRPGGRCFLAEPRSRWRAGVSLKLLWFSARLSRGAGMKRGAYREPRAPLVLTPARFRGLIASQPWGEARCWEDGHYQYALVRKSAPSPGAVAPIILREGVFHGGALP